MEEMVDYGNPTFEEKVRMLLDTLDLNSLTLKRKVKVRVFGSVQGNWLSRLLQNHRVVLYPVASKGQFVGIADPVVISIHGSITSFIWLAPNKRLVIRCGKHFYYVSIHELGLILRSEQRDKMLVCLRDDPMQQQHLHAEDHKRFHRGI